MSEELNIDEQIRHIDENIEVLEWNIKRAEALDKLLGMEEFHLVMMEGYLEIEAQRVFGLLVDPRVVKPETKDSYLSRLETIRNVGEYLGTKEYKGIIKISAENSKQDLDNLIQQKQELIAGKGE